MSITLSHVSYIYDPDAPIRKKALEDVSLEIPKGIFMAVIGHTGSGKSTLIQHFNGLIRPTSGTVSLDGQDIWGSGYSRKELRGRVGLVFQYPEHQLFEETVFKDVCFGPKNQGLSPEDVEKRARAALELTGLGEEFYEQSPFELSGGQKRRAAIAGVLAMDPEYLILDEPTAGLDPQGRDEILDQLAYLQKEKEITVVLVSHSMEDVARYAERLIVMDEGRIRYDDRPQEVFTHYKELEEMGLAAPQVTYLVHALKERGIPLSDRITRLEEAERELLRLWKERKG